MSAYILKMEPLLVPRVWGGRHLETMGKVLPDGQPYGESWEVSDLDEGASRIANGPLAGKTLKEAADTLGAELLGEFPRFPLLVKFLDARHDLSVQVHPGQRDVAAFAAKGQEVFSKDEAWMILHSEDGSILWGVRDPVSAEEFRVSVENGSVVEYLRRFEVKEGDVFRVPPGTIHAICSGVVLLEIQEPSDTTFRLFDYGRPGLDGRPRPLHVDDALRVSQLHPEDPMEVCFGDDRSITDSKAVLLVDCESYRIEKFFVDSSVSAKFQHNGPFVLVSLGDVSVGDVRLRPFETAVVPAAMTSLEVRGEGAFVLAAPKR